MSLSLNLRRTCFVRRYRSELRARYSSLWRTVSLNVFTGRPLRHADREDVERTIYRVRMIL